jgi:hypothetical protein
VVRRLGPGANGAVIVQGEESLRILMPGWMLDEGYCRMLVVEDRPRVSVEALVALRAVIDAQQRAAGAAGGGCGCVVADENNHEPSAAHSGPGTGAATGNT